MKYEITSIVKHDVQILELYLKHQVFLKFAAIPWDTATAVLIFVHPSNQNSIERRDWFTVAADEKMPVLDAEELKILMNTVSAAMGKYRSKGQVKLKFI